MGNISSGFHRHRQYCGLAAFSGNVTVALITARCKAKVPRHAWSTVCQKSMDTALTTLCWPACGRGPLASSFEVGGRQSHVSALFATHEWPYKPHVLLRLRRLLLGAARDWAAAPGACASGSLVGVGIYLPVHWRPVPRHDIAPACTLSFTSKDLEEKTVPLANSSPALRTAALC